VFEDNGEGWSWGQLHIDGYVGWLPTEALSSLTELDMPTHRVSSLRTLIFPGPSIKLPPMGMLSYGCELAIKDMEGALAVTARDEYVPACHLADKDSVELDFVSIAERFVGTPYLWGGKTSLGIDCSGLVQVSLAGAGDPCPRDSDMQAEFLGLPVEPSFNFSNVQRGDFFFWTGHVAIARNSQTLIHANAFHMAVAIEPIDEAVRRIAEAGSPLKFVKRVGGILRQA
jgi:cell wall-associated NlpC family hydrolase